MPTLPRAHLAWPLVVAAGVACGSPHHDRDAGAVRCANGCDDAGATGDGTADDGAGDTDAGPMVVPNLCGLITNGSAETGDLTGWTPGLGDFAAMTGPTTDAPPPASGSWMFGAGTVDASYLSQAVDVSAWAAFIDLGRAFVHLDARVRELQVEDGAYLDLEALDAGDRSLAQHTSLAIRHDVWLHHRVSLALPAGTRRVRVTLIGERTGATVNGAFFDQVDLCIDGDPPLGEEELLVGPYLTWLTADGVSISWEGPIPAPDARVSYGQTLALGQVATVTTNGAHQHARLTGLAPDMVYYYRLTGLSWPAAIHRFKTAPQNRTGGSFSFIAWGDNQNGPQVFRGLVERMAARAPSFLVGAGDLVQDKLETLYHNQLLAPLDGVADRIPIMAAPGNHDTSGDAGLAQFDEHLPLPSDDIHCWGWRYANVHFLFMDSGLGLALSQSCLDDIFASSDFTTADLRVVVFHEPPRIEYWAGGAINGTETIRLYLEPQLIAAGVDLVVNGHAHLYAWGPKTGTHGVTWVTTGGGGGGLEAPTDFVQDWPEITVTEFRHHFLYATVVGNQMTVQAIADDGTVLHTFTVTH